MVQPLFHPVYIWVLRKTLHVSLRWVLFVMLTGDDNGGEGVVN